MDSFLTWSIQCSLVVFNFVVRTILDDTAQLVPIYHITTSACSKFRRYAPHVSRRWLRNCFSVAFFHALGVVGRRRKDGAERNKRETEENVLKGDKNSDGYRSLDLRCTAVFDFSFAAYFFFFQNHLSRKILNILAVRLEFKIFSSVKILTKRIYIFFSDINIRYIIRWWARYLKIIFWSWGENRIPTCSQMDKAIYPFVAILPRAARSKPSPHTIPEFPLIEHSAHVDPFSPDEIILYIGWIIYRFGCWATIIA